VSAELVDLEAALREVNDPEYPISVVDMGLIRGVELEGATAKVRLTYTSMGCPCKDMIADDVRDALLAVDGVEHVEVQEVFEEWHVDHISARGRRAMRRLGVA
jgi:metal-sulfur cluster biosynthetic enzyme